MATITKHLHAHDYLGAYQLIKTKKLPKEDEYTAISQIIHTILLEMEQTNKNSERIIYLRCMLIWVTRDIPHFNTLYREQQRLAQGNNANVMNNIIKAGKNFNDVMQGHKTVTEGISNTIEETVQNVKDSLDITHMDMQNNEVSTEVNTVVNTVINEGIKQFGNFFELLDNNLNSGKNTPTLERTNRRTIEHTDADDADTDADAHDAEE